MEIQNYKIEDLLAEKQLKNNKIFMTERSPTIDSETWDENNLATFQCKKCLKYKIKLAAKDEVISNLRHELSKAEDKIKQALQWISVMNEEDYWKLNEEISELDILSSMPSSRAVSPMERSEGFNENEGFDKESSSFSISLSSNRMKA